MIIITHISLIIINLTLAFLKIKIPFLSFVSYTYLLLFFVGSRNTVDLYNYIVGFDITQHISGTQYLFYLPMNFCKDIGLDFFDFRLIYSILAIYLIDRCLLKIDVNRHYFIGSYLCYLAFMDNIQIRNFFASTFFYVACSYLLLQEKKWRLKFSLWTFLSSLIHTSFLVYFVFLLVPHNIKNEIKNKYKNSNSVKIVFIASFIFTLFFLFNRDISQDIVSVLSSVDAGRMEIYSKLATNWGGILYALINIITTLFSVALYRINLKSKVADSIKERNLTILGVIVTINILATAFLPFIIMSIEFYRLLRNLMVVNIIGFIITSRTSKRIIVLLGLLSYLFIWFYVTFLYNVTEFSRIIIPIFENNYFFNLF